MMISGCVHCGKPKEGVELFMEMEKIGVKANEVTVVAVLAACADLGALELGRDVHDYSKRCGFDRNVRVSNTLIDMYVKSEERAQTEAIRKGGRRDRGALVLMRWA